MRRLIVSVALVIAGGALAGGPATARSRPTLKLIERAPAVISGANFKPGQRVKLIPSSGPPSSTRASAAGTFRVTFPRTFISRCSGFSVRAVNGASTLAVLRLPRPACMPAQAT